MDVVIGADHAGYDLKEALKLYIHALGHHVIDVGTDNGTTSVDYPDFAYEVGMSVVNGTAPRGVLICGSGVGASIAANKIPGVRASVCHDEYSAAQGVEHDDMNVLVLGGRVVGPEIARKLVEAFLKAHFSNADRHVRRLEKVIAIEHKFMKDLDSSA